MGGTPTGLRRWHGATSWSHEASVDDATTSISGIGARKQVFVAALAIVTAEGA